MLCWEWGGPACRLGALGVLCTWAGIRVSCTGLRHSHAGLNWDGVLGLTGVLHAVLGAPRTDWDGVAAYRAGVGAPCAGSAGGVVSHWAGVPWTGLNWEHPDAGLGALQWPSRRQGPGPPQHLQRGPHMPPGVPHWVLCQRVPWPCRVQLLSAGGGCPSATPHPPTGDLDPSVWVPSSRSHLTV